MDFQRPEIHRTPLVQFCDLAERPGSDLYWINGKPGSGKSTLMNFLADHMSTKALLESWCENIPLVTASFFFWNSGGSSLQKDQKGLLRSVLYQILESNLSLIPVAFPKYYEPNFGNRPWRVDELKTALRNVCFQHTISIKLFLLIDGLDEYTGDYASLATFLKEISKSAYVKICASSRPIFPFDKEFLGLAALRLEYLTFDDIKRYVEGELGQNKLLQKLRQKEGADTTDSLLFEVVEKARGVFLWVEIVVKSLLRGLSYKDDISVLRSRVSDYPPELDPLFQHMMNKLEKFYQKHASCLFQIMRASEIDRSGGPYSDHQLTVERMYFASQTVQTVLNSAVKSLSAEEQETLYEDVDLWLKVRCVGLLEIVVPRENKPASERPLFDHGPLQEKLEYRIDYIHRTARDFLHREEIWSTIVQYSESLDPFLSMLGGIVMSIKMSVTTPHSHDGSVGTLSPTYLAKIGLGTALQADGRSVSDMVRLIDELGRITQNNWQPITKRRHITALAEDFGIRKTSHFSEYYIASALEENKKKKTFPNWHSSILTLAIQSGLVDYAKAKLNHNPSLNSKRTGRPLLDYLARPVNEWSAYKADFAPLRMAELLFIRGCKPNEDFDGTTPWQTLVLHLHANLMHHRVTTFEGDGGDFEVFKDMWISIVELFVLNGADPEARCTQCRGIGEVQDDLTLSAVQMLQKTFDLPINNGEKGFQLAHSSFDLETPSQERVRAIIGDLERNARIGQGQAKGYKVFKTGLFNWYRA